MRISRFLVSLFLTVLWSYSRGADAPAGGIGAILGVDKEGQGLRVIRVIPESPAARAGLTSGLILKSVDATDVRGKSLSDCVAVIRGPIGSKVRLGVLDPRAHITNTLELTREKIAPPAPARLGDPASPLLVKQWVQGGPVDVKDGKAVYVVEFWATWCGPCRTSIPHLNALQKKLRDKGVVVVGISDEEPETVKPFVMQMGAQMEYAVGCDDSAQTNLGFMAAYSLNTIPTAFVVDKEGQVRWVGHPMSGLDKALETILAGEIH